MNWIDALVRRWMWSKPLRCRLGWHRWEPKGNLPRRWRMCLECGAKRKSSA